MQKVMNRGGEPADGTPRANGEQLSKITSLIESGIIRPVMDRIFPFEATKEAWAYLETGRAKGKVVIKVS
jgi:NADPH:quinone reductase-like Zn-dependent oxidoreductase